MTIAVPAPHALPPPVPLDPATAAGGTALAATRDETTGARALRNAALHGLAQVPPEAEWFANLGNPKTQRT